MQVRKKRPGRDGKLTGLVPVLYVTTWAIMHCSFLFPEFHLCVWAAKSACSGVAVVSLGKDGPTSCSHWNLFSMSQWFRLDTPRSFAWHWWISWPGWSSVPEPNGLWYIVTIIGNLMTVQNFCGKKAIWGFDRKAFLLVMFLQKSKLRLIVSHKLWSWYNILLASKMLFHFGAKI
jgi:hypothetical protein